MGERINDGGPAFPFREQDGEGGYQRFPGMSLRDYFAAAAMTGIIGQSAWCGDVAPVVQAAFIIADAMLAARERKESSNG
jgi:hypothetical protein